MSEIESKLTEFEVRITFRSRDIHSLAEAEKYVKECLYDPLHEFDVSARRWEVIE
jgi:hypothetical protein